MNNKFKTILAFIIILYSFNTPSSSQFIKSFHYDEFYGKVIRIIDADTIEVVRVDSVNKTNEYRDHVIKSFGGRMKYFADTVIVIFSEIDCPEKNQAYGGIAKEFILEKCLNKEIFFKEQDQFLSNELIGEVIVLPEIINLNRTLL